MSRWYRPRNKKGVNIEILIERRDFCVAQIKWIQALLSQTITNYTHILRLSEYKRDNSIIVRKIDLTINKYNTYGGEISLEDSDYIEKLFKDLNEYKLPLTFNYVVSNKLDLKDKGFH